MVFRIGRLGAIATFAALAAGYPITWKRQDAGVPKLVVAHHIVGLTSSFTLDTWKNDVALASSKGIDGFALNIGADDFTFTQLGLASQGAAAANPNFKLFLSLDMGAIDAALGCSKAETAAFIRNVTSSFITQPNQLQVNGKAFVSTFAGEACTFGQTDVPTGWNTQFTQHPDLVGKIHFVPSFFIDPAKYKTFTNVMDGAFNFNGGWPVNFITNNAQSILGANFNSAHFSPDQQNAIASQINGLFDVADNAQIAGLAQVVNSAHTYMTAVAPWFFTHLSSKNFIFDTDNHLYVTRWQQVIQNRDKIDIVELATWNDFGESHYLGPIEGNPPDGSADYVNGFDHQGFLEITNHFATFFKTGTEPPITTDQLVMWARPHPANAAATADNLSAPRDFQLSQDQLWAVVLATAPGSLTLATSDTNKQTFDVQAGVNKFNISLTPNGFMSGTLTRDNAALIQLKPTDYTFNPAPTKFNYNIFVAQAAATGGAAAPSASSNLPAPPATSSAVVPPTTSTAAVPPASSDPAIPPASSASAPATPSAATSAAASSAASTDPTVSTATSTAAASPASTDAAIPSASSDSAAALPTSSVAATPPPVTSAVVGPLA
ncbi:glycosyl hydrolase family 71-domain-containing protein [Trametes meyenii]|nr:glycosyl hydrolase family 71-domain-containing protein [Trametes meyenii]